MRNRGEKTHKRENLHSAGGIRSFIPTEILFGSPPSFALFASAINRHFALLP